MAKLNIAELKRIKELTLAKASLDQGDFRAKVTVHMGTCGIASGAEEVLKTLWQEVNEAKAFDILIATSGCMGLCSREPLVTVECKGSEPIKYQHVTANKMRQIFRRHILKGEIQVPFALARGREEVR